MTRADEGVRAGFQDGPAAADRPRLLLAAAETGGRFSLIEVAGRRGEGPPCHLHHWEDESIYVIAGTLDIWLEGRWSEVAAGSAVLLPRLVEHAYQVTSSEARLLVIGSPAGVEGLYADPDAGGLAARQVERLVAAAARYGVEITGPPPRRT